ncbi:MAG: hypothetical protein HDT35_01825 [Clostridiales bacterium]|nr:hypothetical protein [Clostridiales bacterium]
MEKTKNLKLWLPSDTDPLEVSKLSENFKKLDDFAQIAETFKVGDILYTLRTDLGDDWMLCNGESFDPKEYPELSEKLVGIGAMAEKMTIDAVDWGNNLFPRYYATDGTNQLIGMYATDGSRADTVYWSTDNFKTSIGKKLGMTSTNVPVFFANGYWIAIPLFNNNPSISVYTCDTPITGSFTKGGALSVSTDSLSSNYIRNVFHVEYFDGRYYAFCVDSAGSALVFRSDSSDFSNATRETVGASSGAYVQFLRADDKFVFFGWTSSKLSKVCWSSSPASGYQVRSVSMTAAVSQASTEFAQPLYHNGKVFWASTTSTRFAGLVCLAGIETGGVSVIDLSSIAGTGSDVLMLNSEILDAGNGEFVIFCNTKTFFVSKDPENPASWKKCTTTLTQYTTQYCAQFVANDCVCVAFVAAVKGIASIPITAAPKISIPSCYAYVKAR